MKNNEIIKKIVDFNRNAFEQGYDALTAVQGENQRLTEELLGKAEYIPEEVRLFAGNAYKVAGKTTEKFKEAVLTGHDQFEKFIVRA